MRRRCHTTMSRYSTAQGSFQLLRFLSFRWMGSGVAARQSASRENAAAQLRWTLSCAFQLLQRAEKGEGKKGKGKREARRRSREQAPVRHRASSLPVRRRSSPNLLSSPDQPNLACLAGWHGIRGRCEPRVNGKLSFLTELLANSTRTVNLFVPYPISYCIMSTKSQAQMHT